jgi:hypothetical protein
LREAHARGQRIPLRTVRPDLPDAVARVVERALRPDPSQRYQDADDLAQALLPLRPDSRAHRRNRFKVAAAAAAAVLVAVGGIGWGIGFRPGHQTRGAAGPGAQGMVLRELSPEVSLVGGAPSHDGRYVSRPDPETGALVLHEIATGTSVQLATHPKDKWEYANIGQSRFSPDDSQIAYGWVVDGRQELRIIGTSSDVTRPGARCTTTSRPV